jgi:hypothetical protein
VVSLFEPIVPEIWAILRHTSRVYLRSTASSIHTVVTAVATLLSATTGSAASPSACVCVDRCDLSIAVGPTLW